MGNSVTASGDYSFATGLGSSASGSYSIAMGDYVTASGDYSVALGESTVAQGQNSIALGEDIEVGGANSFGIALNDQNSANVSQANTMAIMGGKVGIGTLAPTHNLTVNGSTLIDGDLNVTGITYTDSINSSTSSNISITSQGGSVIINLG